MCTSDSIAASSPATLGSARSSVDLGLCPSTPPSSPPGFPWEQNHVEIPSCSPTQTPRRNVFSILGKRKAPLSSISNNAPPSKRVLASASATDEKPPNLTQLQISVGQQIHRRCKQCGMEYIASSAEDRKLHDRYHKQSSEGYDVGKDFVGKSRPATVYTVSPTSIGLDGKDLGADTVCVIDRRDPLWRRRRAREALDIVQKCLGAVEIPEARLWESCGGQNDQGRYRAYLYLRGTKCVALALAERIHTAQVTVLTVALPSMTTDSIQTTRTLSTVEKLRARHAENMRQDDSPVQLSTVPVPAKVGISRIWTAPECQKQGIATRLLDIVCEDFRDGAHVDSLVDKDMIAFSQPTAAGTRLAKRWFGKRSGWLVYID